MIRIENISKTFRTEEVETLALNTISFEIQKGEFLSIMGPSGCGKSTLLNVIGLLDSPTSGKLYYNGTDVSGFSEMEQTRFRKGRIGFVFQNFNLINELNVYDNIELPLLYLRIPAAERRKKVKEVLSRMQIEHRERHYPQQLSGGQQQRVAVGRAIAANPDLILADEPTGNLDSENGQEVLKILNELNQDGTTVVMVTHALEYAEMASRIIHLLDGKIISQDYLEHTTMMA
jgi:putative ABC transport system ATP-binding protein